MSKKLRLTLIAILTFGSFSIAMASLMTMAEVIAYEVNFDFFDFSVLMSMFAFGMYGTGYTVYRVVTGTEFN